MKKAFLSGLLLVSLMHHTPSHQNYDFRKWVCETKKPNCAVLMSLLEQISYGNLQVPDEVLADWVEQWEYCCRQV